MNIQDKILKLLKEKPMSRIAIVKAIPEEMAHAVNGNLNALLIGSKVIYDGIGYSIAPKLSKYRNVKTEVDGIKFDSKGEAGRYQKLLLLEKAGMITDLKRQVPFIIADAVKWDGKVIRAKKYVCDFAYTDISTAEIKKVVEDFKGKKTDLYLLKRSLFLNRYPEYWFRETEK